MTAYASPALSMCFKVTIDQTDLGIFSTCSGLGCSLEVLARQEGGVNDFVWQLPTRMTYANVTLGRAVGPDSKKLTAWIAGFVANFHRSTACIEAYSGDLQAGEPAAAAIASWSLDGVVPVSWTGPSLDVETSKVATETVVLAHHGFLPDRGYKP